jgi:hypothetical protein
VSFRYTVGHQGGHRRVGWACEDCGQGGEASSFQLADRNAAGHECGLTPLTEAMSATAAAIDDAMRAWHCPPGNGGSRHVTIPPAIPFVPADRDPAAAIRAVILEPLGLPGSSLPRYGIPDGRGCPDCLLPVPEADGRRCAYCREAADVPRYAEPQPGRRACYADVRPLLFILACIVALFVLRLVLYGP